LGPIFGSGITVCPAPRGLVANDDAEGALQPEAAKASAHSKDAGSNERKAARILLKWSIDSKLSIRSAQPCQPNSDFARHRLRVEGDGVNRR
jgi:hypothetical protein